MSRKSPLPLVAAAGRSGEWALFRRCWRLEGRVLPPRDTYVSRVRESRGRPVYCVRLGEGGGVGGPFAGVWPCESTGSHPVSQPKKGGGGSENRPGSWHPPPSRPHKKNRNRKGRGKDPSGIPGPSP